MVFKGLQAVVDKYFEDNHYVVFIAFFFLRFLCPAIVSPKEFGLISKGSPLSSHNRQQHSHSTLH